MSVSLSRTSNFRGERYAPLLFQSLALARPSRPICMVPEPHSLLRQFYELLLLQHTLSVLDGKLIQPARFTPLYLIYT